MQKKGKVNCMRARFGIITLFLVFVISLCVTGTVQSRSSAEGERDRTNYHAVEKDFRRQIRNILEEEGFGECGITMTWTSAEAGSRSYQVLIHHRKFAGMDGQEREQLAERLAACEFDHSQCEFVYEFS